jgi:hypothetical protein
MRQANALLLQKRLHDALLCRKNHARFTAHTGSRAGQHSDADFTHGPCCFSLDSSSNSGRSNFFPHRDAFIGVRHFAIRAKLRPASLIQFN